MGKLKKITLTMEDGEDLEFIPSFESYLSISKGHRDTNDDNNFMGGMIKEPNGNEVFLLVCAPKEIKDEIVKVALEVVDRMINT